MSDQSNPTLVQALLSLPGRTREQLSHLRVRPGTPPQLTCYTSSPEPGPEGPLSTTPDLQAQIQQLRDLGLLGAELQVDPDGQHLQITLWAGEGERTAWEQRMEAVRAHPHAGADLLEHAAQLKATRARYDHARAAAASRADRARSAGLDPSVISRLLQDDHAGAHVAAKPQPLQAEAQPEQAPTATAEFVRMPTGHSAPCAVCGTPAVDTRAGVPLHRGECARLHDYDNAAPAPSTPAAEQRSAPSADPSPHPSPKPPKKSSSKGPDRSRFAAAVAAWDGQVLYLPGGLSYDLPHITHLGDLARLVSTHRLGHGGGAAKPDRGEIFIYPPALEQMGLPLEVARAGHGTREARSRAREQIFGEFTSLPIVQDALAAGWELDEDRMDVRTRLTHPEILPAGADLTVLPWVTYQGNALFVVDEHEGRDDLVDPATLVDRLQEFADTVGMTWRVSGGQTGVDLVDVLRPPTPPDRDPRPGYLIRGSDPAQPDFLRPQVRRSDARFTEGERVFSWYRPWSQLHSDEREHPFVMAFDHGSHFLNPFTSLELGVSDVEHLVGDDARWDGREVPGYWVVDAWEAPRWDMPDPGDAVGMVPAEGLRIVTAHTLKQLKLLDEHFPDGLTYREAWVWRDHARYLSRVGENLKRARAECSPPVAAAVKQVYAQMVQKFASLEYPPTQRHLRQPAFRDHIVGAARTALLSALVDANTRTGASPLVVSRDTVLFAVDTDDPEQAWPGKPEKFGTGAGQWKPVGVAPLETWGPEHLPELSGGSRRWNYERGMGALRPISLGGEA